MLYLSENGKEPARLSSPHTWAAKKYPKRIIEEFLIENRALHADDLIAEHPHDFVTHGFPAIRHLFFEL